VAHVFESIDGYHLPWTPPVVLVLLLLLAEISYCLVERPAMCIGRRSRDPGVTTELIVAARSVP
jgi:peptidoglycan/LPS O-acetylase OafA/YrhL